MILLILDNLQNEKLCNECPPIKNFQVRYSKLLFCRISDSTELKGCWDRTLLQCLHCQPECSSSIRLHLIYTMDRRIYPDSMKLFYSIYAGMGGNALLKLVFRIPDVHHGSQIRTFPSRCPNPGSKKKAPDPGSNSATKNFSIIIPIN
jgi:hypothetical protein